MEIYTELIKSVEQGSSLEAAATNLKSKLIHLIETTKQEIDLFKQQEILLQIACKHYEDLAKNFQSRNVFVENMSQKEMSLHLKRVLYYEIIVIAKASGTFLNMKERWQIIYGKYNILTKSTLKNVDYNDLSEQILMDLGLIINARRNNSIYNECIA